MAEFTAVGTARILVSRQDMVKNGFPEHLLTDNGAVVTCRTESRGSQADGYSENDHTPLSPE